MARSILTQQDHGNIPALNFALESVSTLPAANLAFLGRLVVVTSSKKIYYGKGTGAAEGWENVGQLPASTADIPGLDDKIGLLAAKSALETLAQIVAEKSDGTHKHLMADITDLGARLTGLDQAINGKAPTTHSHTAAAISDFNNVVDTRIAAYFESTAGSDEHLDTLREIIDMIKANTNSLSLMIGRFSVDVGNGSLTQIAINHGLNSLDCSVEVYQKAGGATVLCDVVRTNANVITLGFAVAPAAASLRVVVKV